MLLAMPDDSAAPRATSAQPDPCESKPCLPDTADHVSQPVRILVVDDLVDAAESLAMLLRTIGDYEVATAYDGTAALDAARAQRPHVVFLDIALPRLNGYRVAEQLRSDPLMQGACLIALTGYGRSTDVEQARQSGFDHHLLKPIDLAQLEAVLAAVKARLSPEKA